VIQGVWEAFAANKYLALCQIEFFDKASQVKPAQSTLDAYAKILNVTGCETNVGATQFLGKTAWNDAYEGVIWPIVEPGVSVGKNLADLSRLVPHELVNSPTKMAKVKEYIATAPAPFIWENCKTPPCKEY
jgi:hypothetical protein